jgi:hypothetical protein
MNPHQLFAVYRRREFLRRSAFGLGSIALAELLAREGRGAGAAAPGPLEPRPHFEPRAKNVIFVFMAGAPSHLDLFDPKPVMARLHGQPVPASFLKNLDDPVIKASARVFASPRQFKKYGRAGMDFSDYVRHTGGVADDLCMVRSVYTTTSNHDPGQLLFQCGTTLYGHPAMGAWVSYGLGSLSANLPGFVVLLSQDTHGVDAGTALWSNGFLPASYRGVTFRAGSEPILHLTNPAGISDAVQRSRLDALRELNAMRLEQTGDLEIAARISAYELAYRMQSAAPELVDLSRESRATRTMYGLDQPTTRWFGSNCLLARRLVERGVRFVQLYHSNWDDHSGINQNLKVHTDRTDLPFAALIRDLKQRGLLDTTLVVWAGEFGRTPMNEVRRGINPGHEGRDHHPFGFTVLMAGGGIKAGQVVGATDDLGYHAVEDRVHVHDIQATMLHCLGLDHERLTYRHLGRDFRLTDVHGKVVRKLLA